jgi:fatty acid desaturase
MTYGAQLLDTNTIPGLPLIAELWAPLGMRYHALHHLVPSLPYHEMAKAHKRLMKELPPDSPYRQTIYPNLFAALFAFFRFVYFRPSQNGTSG